jgi:hypothetical protein
VLLKVMAKILLVRILLHTIVNGFGTFLVFFYFCHNYLSSG